MGRYVANQPLSCHFLSPSVALWRRWSAARSDSYGYGVFTVYNATHAHWEQILDEDESVLDQVWITQTDPALSTEGERAAPATKTSPWKANLRGHQQ